MERLIENLATNIGTLFTVLIAYRSGLLRFLINGRYLNGEKTTEGKVDSLGEEIKLIKENHFQHLQKGQDEIKASLNRIENSINNLEKYGIKLRK